MPLLVSAGLIHWKGWGLADLGSTWFGWLCSMYLSSSSWDQSADLACSSHDSGKEAQSHICFSCLCLHYICQYLAKASHLLNPDKGQGRTAFREWEGTVKLHGKGYGCIILLLERE